mgnify:CR=1 FL=1
MTQIIPRDLPIFFDEEKHKYTDALDREYISTTTIIGKFVEQKDWKAIAELVLILVVVLFLLLIEIIVNIFDIEVRLLNRFLLNGRLKLKRLVLRELKSIIS